MTVNLTNPITQSLEIGQLAGTEDVERRYDVQSGLREKRLIRPFS